MKLNRNQLKSFGGLVLNAGVFGLATAATAGATPLLGGGAAIISGLVAAITGNLASNHACTISNLSYDALMERLENPGPETINHDLERVFRQSCVSSLEFIKTLFVSKIKRDERLKDLSKKEEEDFLKALTAFFDENIHDLQSAMENDSTSIDKAVMREPRVYLENIVDQIFRMTSVQFDETTEASLKQFYVKRLPYCFDLAFKETLKKDDKGFKAFQIWVLEDIRTQNAGIVKTQEEILAIVNDIKENAKNFISPAEVDAIAEMLAERIYTFLERDLDGIRNELKRLAKIEQVVEATYHVTESTYQITLSTNQAVISSDERLDRIERKLDAQMKLHSEEIISRSEQVNELMKKIAILQTKKEEEFQKQEKKKIAHDESPGDEDKQELYENAYNKWLATSIELEQAEKQLADVRQFVSDVYVLLYNTEEEAVFSETTKAAKALFEAGEFEKVKELLSSGKRENEREQLLRKEEILQEQKKDFALGDLLNAKTILIDFTDPNRFAKAEEYFRKSIELFPFYENNFEFAYYLAGQKQHNLAIEFYEKSNTYFRDREPDLAATLNNLGNLYSNIQRFQEAERASTEALELFRRLMANNPAYEANVAVTLNNLCNLYGKIQRFQEAETVIIEALNIRRRLAENNPAYEPSIAVTLNSLGNLYSEIQRFQEAESAFAEALKISRGLAENNPFAYEPDVATTLTNLGLLYSDIQRFQEAETAYTEALEIFRRLAKNNPAVYEPNLAMTLNNLGLLYGKIQQFQEEETAYTEALEIFRRLAKNNPAVYEPDLAMTLNNLGSLHGSIQQFQEAESAIIEALEIRRRLARNNPAVYEPNTAVTLTNLGLLHGKIQRFPEAQTAFREALVIRMKIINKSRFGWREVIKLYLLLGEVYQNTSKKEAAIEAVKRSLVVLMLYCNSQDEAGPYISLGKQIVSSWEVELEPIWLEARKEVKTIRNKDKNV